jgi:hypothetical protein
VISLRGSEILPRLPVEDFHLGKATGCCCIYRRDNQLDMPFD